MEDGTKVALLNSRVASAMITAMGMQALNQHWAYIGQAPAYNDSDFQSLITSFKIDTESVEKLLGG